LAAAHEGYVLASVVEEKMPDLKRRLDEAMKLLQEKTSAADDSERKAKEAESKLAAERAAVVGAQDRYAALEAVVQETCQKVFSEWCFACLSHCLS
jgi:ElaB/YqjD/DUF883 family membrane-anchored ribosome-binding protein